MGSIRIREDFLTRMRGANVPVAVIIRSAIERYRAGEIGVTEIKRNYKNKHIPLQIFSTDDPEILKFSGSGINAILAAHFARPRDLSQKIAQADAVIKQLWPVQEYVIEENNS